MQRHISRSAARVAIAAAGLLLFAATAHAQLVQVGPGYVKAPFVRVYARPDGSSYVRAPFVGVYTPPYLPEPRALPTPKDFGEMDWRELRSTVRDLAIGLEAQLDEYPTGDLWKVELKTAEIRALTRGDGPPTADERASLESIRAHYQATRDNPRARPIPSLGVFKALSVGLRELAAPPEEHLHRRLAAAADDLKRALDEFPTGKGWQKYLALTPEAGSLRLPTNDAAVTAATYDIDDLQEVLRRFDSVERDEKFRAIADLDEFRAAHESLAAYIGELNNPPADPVRPLEELPTPKPKPRPRDA